jgi:hypothetical protein
MLANTLGLEKERRLCMCLHFLKYGECNPLIVVVRDECPYCSLKFLLKDYVSFPLLISLSSEVRKVKWTM